MSYITIDRYEVVRVDSYRPHIGHIYYGFDWEGEGDPEILGVDVRVRKTGNISRRVDCSKAKLQGKEGFVWLMHSDRKIRKSEMVMKDGKELSVVPVGRLRYNGTLIYEIHNLG